MNRFVLPTVAGVSLSVPFGPAAAGMPSCQPVRVARVTSELPDDWRHALEVMARATSEPGQPWSCTGADLSLDLDESGSGATLSVLDTRGRKIERHVPEAGELVPTVQAVLATFRPAPEATSEPAQPVQRASAPRAEHPVDSGPSRERNHRVRDPRVIVAPVAGARYGTPAGTVWGWAGARMDIPFSDWSFGIWGRYAEPLQKGDTGRGAQPISEVNLGVSGGYRLLAVPFELRATIDPSVNVVSKEIPVPTPQAERAQGDRAASVDFRVGLGLRAAVPVTEAFRGTIGIEGDWGPESTGVGAYLGIEAVIR